MSNARDLDQDRYWRLKVALVGALGLVLTGAVEANVSGRAELAAGSAPREPLSEPEPMLIGELRPGLGLRLLWPRQTFRFGVEGRAYYRTPNLLGLDRPLLLLLAEGQHTYRASPRLELDTRANVTRGEVDYTSAALAFGTSTPAAELSNPVIGVVAAEGRTGFVWQGTRRYRLLGSVFVSHSEPLGTTATFPTTTSVGFESGQRYQLDQRSFLDLLVSITRHDVDPGVGWIVIPVELGYSRELDARTRLELYAGASWVNAEEDAEFATAVVIDAAPTPGENRLDYELAAAVRDVRSATAFPRGRAVLEHDLEPQRGARLTYRLAATLDAVLDPTLGSVRPLSGVESSMIGRFGRNWTLSIAASAFAATTRQDGAGPGVSDTSLNAAATAEYRITEELRFDFGTRLSTRGSYLFDDDFRSFDRQIFAFAGLSANFGVLTPDAPEPR